MSADESCELFFLVDGDPKPLSTHVSPGWDITDLKKAIINEAHLNLNTSELILRKLQEPIEIKPVATLASRLPCSLSDSTLVLEEPTDAISDFFPRYPAKGHLHIIVQLDVERPIKRRKLEVDPWNRYVSREDTVSALYDKLEHRRWVHVRGTPGSGKSVLAALLRRYINEKEPYTEVVFVHVWPENVPVETKPNTILILDAAQTTYWDKSFWSNFKNPGLQNMRVVAFARHGSSGCTGADNVTPMWIGVERRVGLAHFDCGDGISVGLLFTRKEFDALVQLRFNNSGFSESFLDCVFEMTNGHVGACEDLMKCVIAHESYRRQRKKSAEYTYETFITGVSMADISQAIYSGTVFGRGLPQATVLRENPDVTAVLREVIRKKSIVCFDDYLASNPDKDDNRKAALRLIFRSGWLHTEPTVNGILYTFASPLHRRCIDWKLNGSPLDSMIIEPNLFEFSLAVIQRFSRQSLEKREIGGKTQSIPEDQLQDEFYSASSKHSNGSVSFPEFGTKRGSIDFFIKVKKWGIEMLCDGNRLGQHAGRFTEEEYGEWIAKGWMEDYIIIDFRTQHPRIVHQDVDKLIYVVSVDDWSTVEILDNKGKVIRQYSLLNNS